MGVYGSPDLSKKYVRKEAKKKRKRPQASIGLWIAILIFDILFVLTAGIGVDGVLTALIFDSFIILVISIIYLVYNIVKKNKEKIKDDVIFVLSSFTLGFILVYVLGALVS